MKKEVYNGMILHYFLRVPKITLVLRSQVLDTSRVRRTSCSWKNPRSCEKAQVLLERMEGAAHGQQFSLAAPQLPWQNSLPPNLL